MTVVNLDDHRPHDAQYVACMNCAKDWVAVFPLSAVALECPECGEISGEVVNHTDIDWFKRFMDGKDKTRRTLVLLNAARMDL